MNKMLLLKVIISLIMFQLALQIIFLFYFETSISLSKICVMILL